MKKLQNHIITFGLTFAMAFGTFAMPLYETKAKDMSDIMVATETEAYFEAEKANVDVSIQESKVNDYWYEYIITIKNNLSTPISNWAIKLNNFDASAIGGNAYGCSVTNQDGYVYIKGAGDGKTIGANSSNYCDIKFGIGRGLNLSTASILSFTYDEGEASGEDVKTTYLKGQVKNLQSTETPFGMHGKLAVKGTKLVDMYGQAIQLRGASLHGLQWDVGYNYINKGAFQSLRDEWGINLVRLPVYVTQSGYTAGSKDAMDQRIQDAVKYATELGMYILIDWHVHSETGGETNPNTWNTDAKQFFEKYSKLYANQDNVLYEICNEPVNTPWYNGSGNDLYSYANGILPIIRKNSPDSIVIAGTNTWSQDVDEVASKPLNYSNVMYTIHFYSASHLDNIRAKVRTAVASGTPIFCTEFGVCSADGNGSYDIESANTWISMFDELGISYTCWHLSNKGEKSAYLVTGCNKTSGGWINSDVTTSGAWLVNTNRPKSDAEISARKGTAAVTGVSLDKSKVVLSTTGNRTATLVAKLTPLKVSNKNVTWTSSNPAVATVSAAGVVTAVKDGITTITVKTADGGYVATCTVQVGENVRTIPGTIVLSKAVANATSIGISWQKDANADSYIIYRKYALDTTWRRIGTSTTNSFKDNNVIGGYKYYYTVRGVNELGTSASYDKAGVNAIVTALPAEVKLGEVTVGKTCMKITWGKVPTASSYRVYRRTEEGSYKVLCETESTSFLDETAYGGLTYYYTVRAISKNGLSATYDKTGIAGMITSLPATVVLKNAVAKTNSIEVNWEATLTAKGYYVYRKTAGGSWTKIGKTNDITYEDTTAQKGVTYYYTVKAVNYNGTSASYDKTGVTAKIK